MLLISNNNIFINTLVIITYLVLNWIKLYPAFCSLFVLFSPKFNLYGTYSSVFYFFRGITIIARHVYLYKCSIQKGSSFSDRGRLNFQAFA